VSNLVAAIAGADNAVACPFQQKPDRRLHRTVIVHDQDFCHGPRPWSESAINAYAGLHGSLDLRSRASASRRCRLADMGKATAAKRSICTM
jgi:hypothetical protein